MTLLPISGQPKPEDVANDPGVTGVMARAGLSTMHHGLEDFINAEIARGGNSAALLQGIWLYFIQMTASVSASLLPSAAYPSLEKLMIDCVKGDFVEHASQVRKEVEERRNRGGVA